MVNRPWTVGGRAKGHTYIGGGGRNVQEMPIGWSTRPEEQGILQNNIRVYRRIAINRDDRQIQTRSELNLTSHKESLTVWTSTTADVGGVQADGKGKEVHHTVCAFSWASVGRLGRPGWAQVFSIKAGRLGWVG